MAEANTTANNRIRDIRSTRTDIPKSVTKQVRTEAIKRTQGSHKRKIELSRAQTSSESDYPILGYPARARAADPNIQGNTEYLWTRLFRKISAQDRGTSSSEFPRMRRLTRQCSTYTGGMPQIYNLADGLSKHNWDRSIFGYDNQATH